MSLNRVEIVGGLTRDPEYRVSQHGTAWLRFTVAVNDTEYDAATRQQTVTTTFVTVLVFGHQADTLVETLHQGDEVYVHGKLDQTEVEGKDGGKPERKTRVRAHFVLPTRVRQSAAASASGGDDPWDRVKA